MLIDQLEWISSQELIDYPDAIEFMTNRVIEIQRKQAPECIWFLEHPPLFTLGTSAKLNDIDSSVPFPVYQSGRGGQITYHGPGQLIGYVMIDLNKRKKDIKQFINNLERWLKQVLEDLGLTVHHRQQRTGLWIAKEATYDSKIAALGLRVQKWITSHGFSLNINPDLSHYNYIIPCGIQAHGITSCHQENLKVSRLQIEEKLINHFNSVFQ